MREELLREYARLKAVFRECFTIVETDDQAKRIINLMDGDTVQAIGRCMWAVERCRRILGGQTRLEQ